MRWKIFQVLPLVGENTGAGKGSKQDVTPLLVTDALYNAFLRRNREALLPELQHVLIAEDNATMMSSYILVSGWKCTS